MENLWLRLKERKLVQWALAYLAGAWLLLQVLDVLGQNFDWPRSVFRSATVLLGIGFLAALVLAWYHGEQGRQRMGGVELLMLTGILVVAGVAMALMGRGEDAQAEARLGGAAPEITLPRAERNSVAVLPFANLSESKENEYFSDGITDEILTTLANIRDLRVISRTSVMQYKGTAKPLRQIAAELGVAHVLEGSVQRAGDRVRITAQLIDAQTDAHLWAERYDRPLQDIFAVQSEIAQQIARALQAELSPSEQARLERRPTTNLVAHDYVLRATEYLRTPSPSSTEAALSLLRRARELDPSYADAHAALSATFVHQFILGGEFALLDSAVVTAQRAVALDPEFAPGYASLGNALMWRRDREAALEAQLRAVQLNPNLSDGLATVYTFAFGQFDEAARWWRPAIQTDPTNSTFYYFAGFTYEGLGMTARAREFYQRALELQQGTGFSSYLYYQIASTYLAEGRLDEARAGIDRMLRSAEPKRDAVRGAGVLTALSGDLTTARSYFEQSVPEYTEPYDVMLYAWILQQSGEGERVRSMLQGLTRHLIARSGGQPALPWNFVDMARIRVVEGNREEALRYLEAAVRQGWRFPNDRPGDPILGSLRGDPRYDRLVAEMKADVDRMRARVEREGW